MRANSDEGSARVALVTAGARRVGKAIALHLASLGFDIALHYNTSEGDAHKTCVEIEALGRRCFTFKTDLSDMNAVESLIPEVIKKLGRLDLIVNNASVFLRNQLKTAKLESFDLDFAVHVKAPFFLIQSFARHCAGGLVINIVDSSVTRFSTEYFTYLLSKKALFELTKMAARELAPSFRVNAIAPGIVLVPDGKDKAKFDELALSNPLHRIATPENIVQAVEYLVRNQQVTGDCLFVDGGDAVAY